MPQFWVNRSGAWHQVKQFWVNRGGTWHQVKEAFVNKGGSWSKVFSAGGLNAALVIPDLDSSVIGGEVTTSIVFGSQGLIGYFTLSPTYADWYSPNTTGIGASYYIRYIEDAGDGVSGPSGFVSLSSGRTWSITAPDMQARYALGRIQIATDALGSNVVYTSNQFTMTANSAT